MYIQLVAEKEINICESEEEEVSWTRNLLIYTLVECKHRYGDENESCGFLSISANKASVTSSVM